MLCRSKAAGFVRRVALVAVLMPVLAAVLGGCTGRSAEQNGTVKSEESTAASTPAPVSSAVPPAKGSSLTTITQPPGPTLAMIEVKAATPGSSYKVTFQPFGATPDTQSGGKYVIAIVKSEPIGHVAKAYKLANRNALVSLATTSAPFPTSGGKYEGTITLKEQGGLLVPWLSISK